jgi:3-dehydroquinate synthase
MMHVPVALSHAPYTITIGERLLTHAGEHLAAHLTSKKAIVVTDEAVGRIYLHRLSNALASIDVRSAPVLVPVGEGAKSLPHFTALLEQILALAPDRNTTLIALGGGVVGDLTGFAASVVLRGLPFIQIPTTLLAQVDSSVGGKTGVNTAYGKNVVGSFYQPKAVLIDVDTLETLPLRERLAGYAEVVKYGAIGDADFFAWLEHNGAALLAGDKTLQMEAIAKSCKAKAAVVMQDEKETKGLRALLNFGHTFGHALEAEMGYSDALLHGEAVAIGMVFAAKLSAKLGHLAPEVAARLEAHLRAVGLHTSVKNLQKPFTAEALLTHMTHDKKAENGALTFVLLKAMGQAFVAKHIAPDSVRALLQEELM